eukprot:690618-Rhodomonas_salina.2
MCGTNRGFSAARRLAIDANEKQERVAVQLLQAHFRSIASRRVHCALIASALTIQVSSYAVAVQCPELT